MSDELPPFRAAAMRAADDAVALIQAVMAGDPAAEQEIRDRIFMPMLTVSCLANFTAGILNLLPAEVADQAVTAGKSSLRDRVLDLVEEEAGADLP